VWAGPTRLRWAWTGPDLHTMFLAVSVRGVRPASLADLEIRHLVSDGEVWLLVKIDPNFGHDRR
jgi:hypothetical protein